MRLKNDTDHHLDRHATVCLVGLSILCLATLPVRAFAGTSDQVQLVNYVARVEVMAENRSDIDVTVNQGPSKLPVPRVSQMGDKVIVDGGIRGDKSFFGFNMTLSGDGLEAGGMVRIKGFGQIPVKDLPVIVIRAPMHVKLISEGTAFGHIGRCETLDLSERANGDWRVEPVSGSVSAATSGAGDIHLATAGDVVLSSSGSGDITVGDIQSLKSGQAGSGDIIIGRVFGPVEVSLAGSGDAQLRSVRGNVSVSIAGSGDVHIHEGMAPKFNVSIAGSGDVAFGGTAGDVTVSIAGSGDVSVAHATGRVAKNIIGSGDVHVGQ